MRDGEQFRDVFCFEGFEVDARSGELRKLGRKLRLQDQPFRLLRLLIERKGEVVTREELRTKLWPADTFVDFDHGLNSAVARVREVLNDSAATPRFIETLPKRGYRFLAPVEVRSAVPEAPVAPAVASSEEKFEPSKVRSQWPAWVVVFGCLAGVLVVAGIEIVRPKEVAVPRVKQTVQLTNDGQLKGNSATDGVRLYFQEKIAGKFLLKQVSVLGGEVSTVNPLLEPSYVFDLSPNRSELMIGGEIEHDTARLFTVALPSGTPRALNVVVAGACWLRDGSHIAYVKGKDVYMASSDGTNARRLATLSGWVSDISASPDGTRLRFTQFDDQTGHQELSELSLKDGSLTSLTPEWKENPKPCCGVWSPDGRYYYFQTLWGSKFLDGDIWVMSGASGKGRRIVVTALTHGPLALGESSIDPSGRALYARGMLPRAQLVRYDSKTSTLVPYLNGISAHGVDISRDKQWITYVSYPEYALWRSRLDGSEKLQLSFGPEVAFLPRWSPDGKEIAFTDVQERGPAKIKLVSRDGGPTRELLPKDRYGECFANWTSDGKSIVFGGGSPNQLGIYQFDFETGKVTQVPGSKDLTFSRISQDQRYIAALSGNWKKLFLFDNRTKHWSEIFQVEWGWVNHENFSADGKYIYVAAANVQQGHRILKIRISDHKTTLVADLKGVAMPDPTWAGLAEDDSPLIRIDKSTREIYRLDLEFP